MWSLAPEYSPYCVCFSSCGFILITTAWDLNAVVQRQRKEQCEKHQVGPAKWMKIKPLFVIHTVRFITCLKATIIQAGCSAPQVTQLRETHYQYGCTTRCFSGLTFSAVSRFLLLFSWDLFRKYILFHSSNITTPFITTTPAVFSSREHK